MMDLKRRMNHIKKPFKLDLTPIKSFQSYFEGSALLRGQKELCLCSLIATELVISRAMGVVMNWRMGLINKTPI